MFPPVIEPGIAGNTAAARRRMPIPTGSREQRNLPMQGDSAGRAPEASHTGFMMQAYTAASETLLPPEIAAHLELHEKAAFAIARASGMVGLLLGGARGVTIARSWWAGERLLPTFMPWAYRAEALITLNNAASAFVLRLLTNRAELRLNQATQERG